MTATTARKPERLAREMWTITCAGCGKEEQVRIPRYCRACWELLRDRGKTQASEHVKEATDANKVIVFDRKWLKENGKP